MPVMMPLVVFVLKQCLFSRPLSRDFIAAAEIFLLLFINEQNHEKVVRCCDDSFLVGQIKKSYLEHIIFQPFETVFYN